MFLGVRTSISIILQHENNIINDFFYIYENIEPKYT